MRSKTTRARLFQSAAALSLAVTLSSCASLSSALQSLNSGHVTSPEDMSKEVHFISDDDLDEPKLAEPAAQPLHLIMPGQMKARPVDVEFFSGPSLSGFQAVSYANQSAAVQPTSENYLNAIQIYPYTPGSLYQVYTSPTQVTDIALERGEVLTSVSAGDTDRWTVGDTVSGSGPNEQVHILVRPMADKLSTNAIITTTKRTYYLDLKSFADTYMAAVSWRYPHDAIKQIKKLTPPKPRLIKSGFEMADLGVKQKDLRFAYRIKGDTPHWRPTRVFDDGKKVFIEFPKGIAVSEAPPLFLTDARGKTGKLVNYRVKGEFYIVDRLFDAAELRLGEKSQTIVRIERET